MHVLHKNYELSGLKTAGLADGEFIGWASTYGNIDAQGDRVVKGAFAASVKSITDGDVTPVLWEHKSDDPRMQVGQIKSAEETDEGLRVHVALDLDTETGRAAYKAVKSRRVKSLSIGYGVLQAAKAADGAQELKSLDLVEVSLVARPANDRATITASKAADKAGTPALVKARKAAAEFVAADETDDKADEDTTEMTVGERLVASLEAALAAAQDLIDAAEAEGRDLTDEEAESVEKAHGRARRNKADLEAWEAKSPSERHGLQFLADVIDGRKCSASEFTARWGTSESPAEALTKSVSTPLIQTTKHTTKEFHMDTQDKFLQFGSGRKAAAQTIVAKMLGTDNANAFQGGSLTGTKALTTSGQVITDVPVASEVMATGRPAVSILDVIPTNQRSGPMYRYIRQTSRALDAAAVAPGAEKPVSAMGTTTVDAQVSVIAHLSEPIDKFVLSDAPQLARFVQEEMLYGLAVAIQGQVLSGDGTGANQTGLLNTSGVQVQAFATNILTSIRKAITAQESLGYAPSVLVISPADWEALELLATTDAALSYRGVPLDQGERRIWGLRAVLSTSLPAKTALVLDPNAVSIDTVGGVEVEWAKEAGDLFSHNQIQARVETRIGVSVYQPAAVVKVATAA